MIEAFLRHSVVRVVRVEAWNVFLQGQPEYAAGQEVRWRQHG